MFLMKKLGAILILYLLVVSFLSFIIVQAQESSEMPGDVQKIQETGETFSDENTRTEYLNQKWNLLEQSEFGRFLLKISSFLEKLNPFFKSVLGVEFSLSWNFFIALLILIALFVIVYSPFKNYIFIEHKVLGVVASLIVVLLMTQLGVMKTILSFLEIILKNIYYTLVAIVVIIALLSLYSLINKKFGEKFKADVKKAIEKRREVKAEVVEKKHNIELER